MKLTYFAKAENGTLKVTNRKGLVDDLLRMDGKQLVLTIEKKKNTRSLAQNRYYWGVVVPIVRAGLIDAGWEREKINNSEAVHELLKSIFCPKRELINENTGEVLELPPTTTGLSTTGMMEYFADIQRWAMEFLGCTVPDPGEQVEMNFEYETNG